MSPSPSALESLRIQALHEMWRRGLAYAFFLDEGQQGWRHRLRNAPLMSSTVWNIGRQRGKTFCAVLLALETGLSVKNGSIRYCAKTKESALGFVMPAWNMLTETMPEDIRPVKGHSEYEYIFPSTGAVFKLFGTDAQSFDKGRGPKTDLQIMDECGFYQDLIKVENALIPAIMTVGGKVLYVSTPAESLAHPYTERIRSALKNGRLEHDTFYSNPRVDHQAVIAQEAERLGMTPEEFVKSTYFQREFLAELVQEESRAGFPAFTFELQTRIVKEFEIPKYFDGYTSMDLGITHDPHAAVFALHDWREDKLLIVDEILVPSGTTTLRMFADMVRAKEKALYGELAWRGTIAGAQDWYREWGELPEYIQAAIRASEPTQPYLRLIDDAQGGSKELSIEHQLSTLGFKKDNKSLSVDNLNIALAKGEILIHPRCKNLISQLGSATWDLKKSKWIRTPSHHFDLTDCLVGLRRHWRRSRKEKLPVPPVLQFKPQHIIDQEKRAANPTLTNLTALKGLIK